MAGNDKGGLIVQPRDMTLLRELATMRLIDRDQAMMVARFKSVTRANTRLLGLMRAGLLNRYFTGSITGGRKAMYALSKEGAALVGAPFRVFSRQPDQTLAGDLFLQHQQAINRIYLAMKFQPVPFPGVRLIRWMVFPEPPIKTIPLTPDAYCEIETPQGIRSMFLEIDLGTESMKVWTGKVRAYMQLALSGEFTKLFGRSQFRVLALAPSDRRIRNMRAATASLTEKIFWFAGFDAVGDYGTWASIWSRPVDGQLQSLI